MMNDARRFAILFVVIFTATVLAILVANAIEREVLRAQLTDNLRALITPTMGPTEAARAEAWRATRSAAEYFTTATAAARAAQPITRTLNAWRQATITARAARPTVAGPMALTVEAFAKRFSPTPPPPTMSATWRQATIDAGAQAILSTAEARRRGGS